VLSVCKFVNLDLLRKLVSLNKTRTAMYRM